MSSLERVNVFGWGIWFPESAAAMAVAVREVCELGCRLAAGEAALSGGQKWQTGALLPFCEGVDEAYRTITLARTRATRNAQ